MVEVAGIIEVTVMLGFSGVFTFMGLMIKFFLAHKKESNDWKHKHDIKLAKLEQKIEDKLE